MSLPRILGGLILTVFGGYILYEKVLLSLMTGQTEERSGMIERTEEGFSFWLTISTYTLCAGFIFVAGLAALFSAFKPRGK